jgi:hypothetical protein
MGCLFAFRPASPIPRKRERLRAVETAGELTLDRDFHLAHGHGSGQATLGANRQALANGIGAVRLSLGFLSAPD